MTRVAFLPDWRIGNNYQSSLAHALQAEGVEVVFPTGYRRVLPLTRSDFGDAALLHLHWPEPYFAPRRDRFSAARRLRFFLDLRLATRRRPLIYTAHNMGPHNREDHWIIQHVYRTVLARSAGVIAHSVRAAEKLIEFCPAVERAVHVMPHGDAAGDFPALPDAALARHELGLASGERVVLIFGRAEPYKGLEEIVTAWSRLHPTARLWIAGAPQSPAFSEALHQLGAGNPRITFELTWLDPKALATRLAAADAVLFNYRRIFTSGAGCLARSLGRKIVLPSQADTVDLMEPSPTVFRFRDLQDLSAVIARAVIAPPEPSGTTTWRAATSWQVVANKTAAIYRAALR
ncbi:MAG: hypothetical protein RIQ93_1270 [Verrucomicrobiota bacterium]|jgi:glycosyltransferase involved in cell wall biosynthesis